MQAHTHTHTHTDANDLDSDLGLLLSSASQMPAGLYKMSLCQAAATDDGTLIKRDQMN